MTSDPSRQHTLFHLARARAERHPERLLLTFLVDGDTTEERLTYGELDHRARRVAACLQQWGGHGERALLMYEPGIAYNVGYYGCLYAGWTPVPAYPPNPLRLERTLPRVRAILGEVRPRLVLTTAAIRPLAEPMLASIEEARGIPVVATDSVEDGAADGWRPPSIRPEDLAVLQYTSGSIGSPKGVRIPHRALLANLEQCAAVPGTGEDTCIVSWLPPYHDMGLVGGVLWPLFVGGRSVNFSPLHFLARPIRWLAAITRERCDNMVGPNFAYQLCVRKVTEAERDALDLSTIEVAWNGAEPIGPEVLRRFADHFGPCGFRAGSMYPCYGLAESTLLVAGGERGAGPRVRSFSARGLEQGRGRAPADAEDSRSLVSCGTARPGSEIRIVDPVSRRAVVEGVVGEIWVRGPSVGGGYHDRRAETEETFHARCAEGEGPFLRTGDLGFFEGGELFVAGRLKDLVIVRGRNLYPRDLELAVEGACGALRPGCTAAFRVDAGGEEHLAIVAEVDVRRIGAGPEAFRTVLRQIVEAVGSGFDVRPLAVTLVAPGAVPKTPSGKLQRTRCQQLVADGELEVLASWPEE